MFHAETDAAAARRRPPAPPLARSGLWHCAGRAFLIRAAFTPMKRPDATWGLSGQPRPSLPRLPSVDGNGLRHPKAQRGENPLPEWETLPILRLRRQMAAPRCFAGSRGSIRLFLRRRLGEWLQISATAIPVHAFDCRLAAAHDRNGLRSLPPSTLTERTAALSMLSRR